MRTISEDKKSILIELLKELENDLCSLLNNIENDETVTKETWESIDARSGELFYKITQIREELIFS